MKRTFLLCAAVFAAASLSPVWAAPMLNFVDNNNGSVTLQVTPDAALLPGSLGAETALTVQGVGVDFIGVSIADPAVWDFANPGSNPFTGTTTDGLYLNLPLNQIFASYGSAVLNSPAPTDFLTINYTGAGSILANGVVAQDGQNFSNLATSIVVGDALLPTIQFVNNGNGTVTLQIVAYETGSTGSELAFSVQVGDGLSIESAMIVDSVFDTPNPGDNPFTGTVTNGLYTNFAANQVFASYGSDTLSPGIYDFLTLGVSGYGTLEATGLVAQLGSLNPGLTASITLVPEPTTAVLVGLATLAAFARRAA
ncbi:PEP-CTERM sorting domain-containing protein [Botrimarina mediterranea]|uniref:PEP-CTERM protein-sorting domain-containing protein n=1 Tax=Botrimarina mediterranea TaxID=2528022 RepID=A0A518KCL2_9BACT|nr:PEP-CTERM sorting domain-containing protein [Botrimarina mediterranea]QDV75518.1 hypothetical protein Spa11_37360 [Botrimarina mediterranea]QDV80152.1 hypothetical protein K2D_37760 [Planctomycetes bacterium K2D]